MIIENFSIRINLWKINLQRKYLMGKDWIKLKKLSNYNG
jgi:hypothetical protein